MKVPFCMFDVLGLAGGTSGWWYPWATNSWSKTWGIIHKICYWAVLGMDSQGKTPISPGAAVLVLLSHTIPRINQECQGIMRNWWSLQKALTALPVMQPCQGHAKKSILQRILRSLRSAARRLALMLCSGMQRSSVSLVWKAKNRLAVRKGTIIAKLNQYNF